MTTQDSTPLPDSTRKKLAQAGEEFLMGFLGEATRRRPVDAEALAAFSEVLTRAGRFKEGLRADRRLARLRPEDPVVHYNLACSLALTDQSDEAIDALTRSLELGYDDLDHLLQDGDLLSLHGMARFQAIVQALGG